jgi:hypothetical protein
MLTILNALFVVIPESSGQKNEADKKEQGNTGKIFAKSDDKKQAIKDADKIRVESELLRKENETLRKELIETIDKYNRQGEILKRLKLSIAGALGEEEKLSVSDREEELLESLNRQITESQNFASNGIEHCRAILEILEKSQMDGVEKAKLRLLAEDYLNKSRNMLAITRTPENGVIDRCRILEINQGLNVVVLSAGYVNGLTSGLVLYSGKAKEIELQAVSVRPFISAAIVRQGSLKDLAPGMAVYISRQSGNIK